MEFWGVEIKSGESLDVNLHEGQALHLSQACLGEIKNDSKDNVRLQVTFDGKTFIIGTLHSERLPQLPYDLVFYKYFQISHTWKNGSVYFHGYTTGNPNHDHDDSEDSSFEDEEKEVPCLQDSEDSDDDEDNDNSSDDDVDNDEEEATPKKLLQ